MMRLKFLFATIATHMVAPLPAHVLNALLCTLVWLLARAAFVWYTATPKPIASAYLAFRTRILAARRAFGAARSNVGSWHLRRG